MKDKEGDKKVVEKEKDIEKDAEKEKDIDSQLKENNGLELLKRIIIEREKLKDKSTTCEWCGMTYPKGGWTFYKITVMNMDLKKIVENIEKGEKEHFDIHIICSDCYDHLDICKEC